jgi:hypothetical protein
MSLDDQQVLEGYHELGPIVHVFRPRRWGIGIVVCTVALAVLIPTIIYIKSIDNKNPLVVPFAISVAASGMGVLLCVIMLFMSLKQRVVVCEHGVLVQAIGRKQKVLWEDVDALLFYMAKLLFGRRSSIITRQGEQVVLPQMIVGLFPAYCQLSERIRPRLFQEIQKKLGSAQTVSFGKDLGISHEGLYWKGTLVRWSDLKELALAGEAVRSGNRTSVRSSLFIETSTGKDRMTTKDIPNVLVLLDYIEREYSIKVQKYPKIFG